MNPPSGPESGYGPMPATRKAAPFRGSRRFAVAALLLLSLAAGWSLRGCFVGEDSVPETGLSLTSLLGGGEDGFARAEGPRPFRFPEDHGPHPDFRTEWWYFTGNLKDTAGKEFGYQLTFFRSGLRPPGMDAMRKSPWAAGDAYMAHFALSEISAGRFHARERFSRAAMGLAGAEAGAGRPFRVWLEDWKGASESADGGFFPLRLKAGQGGVSLDLLLNSSRPMVLQGDRGFSRKGPEPGNASFYYSYTRMPSNGYVTTPDGAFSVSGESWMDREWGSSILSPGMAGWEWFGLRLADSTEYLFFRLRGGGLDAVREDSTVFDYGMRIDAQGAGRTLGATEMEARILGRWKSPRGKTYPLRWLIKIPSDTLEMEISPALENQELNLSITYWEGAIRVQARKPGRMVPGEGYMELTGY